MDVNALPRLFALGEEAARSLLALEKVGTT